MSMIFCRGCGKEIHETAVTCPHCGAPQSTQPSIAGKGKWGAGRMAVYSILSFIPAIGLVLALIGILNKERRSQGFALLGIALVGTITLSVLANKRHPSPEASTQKLSAFPASPTIEPRKAIAPADDLTSWPTVNVTALVGKPASHIIYSEPTERGRYSKLVGNNAKLDDYLTTTIFSDEDASAIQDIGDYLVIISEGVIRRDTGPMDGAYAIHKTTGKPTAILLKGGEFTILGATAQTLPPPLKAWAKENGAAL